mmetsp:Transcript_17356/g.56787  ORF Transcript_17356/g.56787 Transcript_17356/m.56787 type:complete len:396 (+) Transcript_17356:32-1219(+)
MLTAYAYTRVLLTHEYMSNGHDEPRRTAAAAQSQHAQRIAARLPHPPAQGCQRRGQRRARRPPQASAHVYILDNLRQLHRRHYCMGRHSRSFSPGSPCTNTESKETCQRRMAISSLGIILPKLVFQSHLDHRDAAPLQVAQEETATGPLRRCTHRRDVAALHVVQRLDRDSRRVKLHHSAPWLCDEGQERLQNVRDGVPQPPMAAEESRQRAEPRHETEPEAAIRSSGNAIGKARKSVQQHLRLSCPRALEPVAQDSRVARLDHRDPALVLGQRHAIGEGEPVQHERRAAGGRVEHQQPPIGFAIGIVQQVAAHRVVEVALGGVGDRAARRGSEVDGPVGGHIQIIRVGDGAKQVRSAAAHHRIVDGIGEDLNGPGVQMEPEKALQRATDVQPLA